MNNIAAQKKELKDCRVAESGIWRS